MVNEDLEDIAKEEDTVEEYLTLQDTVEKKDTVEEYLTLQDAVAEPLEVGKCRTNKISYADGFRYVTHRHKGDRRIESPWRGGVAPL